MKNYGRETANGAWPPCHKPTRPPRRRLYPWALNGWGVKTYVINILVRPRQHIVLLQSRLLSTWKSVPLKYTGRNNGVIFALCIRWVLHTCKFRPTICIKLSVRNCGVTLILRKLLSHTYHFNFRDGGCVRYFWWAVLAEQATSTQEREDWLGWQTDAWGMSVNLTLSHCYNNTLSNNMYRERGGLWCQKKVLRACTGILLNTGGGGGNNWFMLWIPVSDTKVLIKTAGLYQC